MFFPDIGIISNVKITQYIPAFRTESLSGKVNTKERGIHRLEGSFDLTLREDELREFEAFLLMIRNSVNQFDLFLSGRFDNNDVKTNPRTNAIFKVGGNGGKIIGGTGTINPGDYFKMSNDPKLYMCLTSQRLSTGIEHALECYPYMKHEYSIGSEIVFVYSASGDKSLPIRVNITDSSQTLVYGEGGLINTITIKFQEATLDKANA